MINYDKEKLEPRPGDLVRVCCTTFEFKALLDLFKDTFGVFYDKINVETTADGQHNVQIPNGSYAIVLKAHRQAGGSGRFNVCFLTDGGVFWQGSRFLWKL